MKRIILMVLYNIILVPYLYFKLCYYASHADKYPEAERYEVLKLIDRRAMKGGRITIDAHGVENLPAKDGFMFFPNHQGDVYKRQGLALLLSMHFPSGWRLLFTAREKYTGSAMNGDM